MKLEDIIHIEVPLIGDGVLSSEYGANIYFLDGSVYPITATIKDLRNAGNILMDRESGLDYIVYYDITTGNSGRSHGILTNLERENTGRHILTVSIIPKGYKNLREDLKKEGSIVVEKNFSNFINKEEINQIVYKELERRGVFWPELNILSASNGRYNGLGYKRLGEEILRQKSSIDMVFIPYGSGETGIGIYNFFKEKFDNGEVQKMPTIIFAQLKDKKRIKGKNLTEDKTRTNYIAFEDEINRLVADGKVKIIDVSESERDMEYKFLKEHGIRVEKTSALTFAGARKYDLNRKENVVIINSGEGKSYKKKLAYSAYESNLSRVAASILIGALSFSTWNSQYTDMQERVQIEFTNRFGRVSYSPAVGDLLLEQREAFINGIVVKNPYYQSEKSLKGLVKEGKDFKRYLSRLK